MRSEVPVCKRCCFCLPLRYGLITWGYLKMIVGGLLSTSVAISLYKIIALTLQYGTVVYGIGNTVIVTFILVTLLTDVALNAVFVVGGHTKNAKLLRVYYIYSIVMLGLNITGVLLIGCFMLSTVMPNRILSFSTWLLVLDFSGCFVNIVIHAYFLLLVRSEIIKLKNSCEFRFVNNAAEAECTMKCEDGSVGNEKETGDVCSKGISEKGDVCEITCESNGRCHKNDYEN